MSTDQNTESRIVRSAQIFWDFQDPRNQGWVLRYTGDDGIESTECIDADRDVSSTKLADLAMRELPYWTGRIRVFDDGGRPSLKVTVDDGAIVDMVRL